jgi:hypothetical protein
MSSTLDSPDVIVECTPTQGIKRKTPEDELRPPTREDQCQSCQEYSKLIAPLTDEDGKVYRVCANCLERSAPWLASKISLRRAVDQLDLNLFGPVDNPAKKFKAFMSSKDSLRAAVRALDNFTKEEQKCAPSPQCSSCHLPTNRQNGCDRYQSSSSHSLCYFCFKCDCIVCLVRVSATTDLETDMKTIVGEKFKDVRPWSQVRLEAVGSSPFETEFVSEEFQAAMKELADKQNTKQVVDFLWNHFDLLSQYVEARKLLSLTD